MLKRSLDTLKLLKDETELEKITSSRISHLLGLLVYGTLAVKVIRAAGVFMITGDFMITAVAIAKQVFNCIFSVTSRNHHTR